MMFLSSSFLFQVSSIIKSFRWAPFIPVSKDSSMLTVLLLLSKYRMRNVPVIETGKPEIKNFITQSAVVQGLEGCGGRDWFDSIAAQPISDFGLPFMSSTEVSFALLNECSSSSLLNSYFQNVPLSSWPGCKHPGQ